MQSALRTLPLISAVAATAFAVSASAQFSGPSFGMLVNKKKVTLMSKLPPIYNATDKTVEIEFVNPNGQLETEIELGLEKQLIQNDSKIHVGGSKADIRVTCKVGHYSAPRIDTTNVSDGQEKRLIGDLSVLYRITEVNSKRTITSGSADPEVNDLLSKTTNAQPASKMFGMKTKASGPSTNDSKSRFSTTDDVTRYLIAQVDHQIAGYLVNSQQGIEVPLAVGGALSDADKYAMSNLWTRDLETLETMTPDADAHKDAYRIYNIGVANEALAYQTIDVQAAIKYLEQASNDYGKAQDAKPDEKGFLDPQTRIKAALVHYEQIGKFLASAGPDIAEKAKPAEAPLTDQDVIDMVKAHLDEANIVDTIQNAATVTFDLGPKGQIALTKGGVNGKVLLAMKQKARSDAGR